MKKIIYFFIIAFMWLIISTAAYSQDVAVSTNPCLQEQTFVQTRQLITHSAIEKMVGAPCQHTPTIAFCLSGGGYRAMISCLGFLIAAQSIGLLDATTYTTGLSGSTWLLGSLLSHKNINPSNKESLAQYRNQLKQAVKMPLFSNLNTSAIETMFIKKYVQGQSLYLADIWGAIIANKLLGDLSGSGQKVYFSECAPTPQKFPYPLFTMVIDPISKQVNKYGYPCEYPPEYYATHKIADVSPYQWLELSPHNVESDYLQAQTLLKIFGNKFSNKKRCTNWPEQNLGYFFGICGSPYAISLGDIIKALAASVDNYFIKKILSAMTQWHSLYVGRFAPTTPPNYTFKLQPSSSPLSHKSTLTLIDAGFDFNLPIPPLLKPQRTVDIIFICDASSDASLETYPQLRLAADYAKQNNLKFPDIEKPTFKNESLLIFNNANDPQTPTIVYIPNKIQNSTLKLQYSNEEFETLCSYMESTVVRNASIFIDVIRQRTQPL